ncbi:glycosyltransferase 61 family protein [Aquicoccus sp. G2-2]|uniref:glycosyltransferase family 61 protein n=1 Tax=Aquicoccus sp. G2-2 TaxID=3092120 RepID=UPI002ADF4AD6|nr:glycosyltransferase family 61 protein [Aquicoccus sp. G2-2]MEA1114738.1 glycosyltransferase family 61 protein [Aquicoccus sp. G2-2]
MGRNDPATAPDPLGGWSCTVKEIPDAFIVPPAVAAPELYCGVFTDAGKHVPRGATWLRGKPVTLPPETVPNVVRKLDGEWLWGGVIYGHFGHFLTESIARLWAVSERRERLSGVIFVDKYGRDAAAVPGFIFELFQHLIGDLPVMILNDCTQVTHLHVPGQGFGLGHMSTGTRAFRRFISDDFARGVKPEGPERLFITRSQLGQGGQGLVGEAIFDDRMARAGYEIFAPETHDLTTQIARYRAAKMVVGLDGSAFHLFGLVAQKEQKVGVILRREKIRSRGMRTQLEAFAGRPPHVIDALGGKAEIDDFTLIKIGAQLKKAGLIGAGVNWGALTAEEREFIAVEAKG